MNQLTEHPKRELVNVRSALYRQPWAITEDWLLNMCNIADAHANGTPPQFEAALSKQINDSDLPFDFTNNVAIVPVQGPIFPKATWMTRLSGATSLEDLKNNLILARELTPSAAIMNFDSPGGAVMGLADFCDWLKSFCNDSPFPVIGLVNPLCASAAYMIASQCDQLYSTGGGLAGSIGVIGRMDNWDRADRNAGNDPVILRTHELKAIGMGGPITPNQQTELQRSIQAHFAKFKQAVGRGRPQVDLDEAATGQMWMGEPADGSPSSVEMGLVDGISTLEKLIQEYGVEVF